MGVNLLGDLRPDTKIWRYMTLDKYIHLLDSETLYFSTLNEYSRSDPFEGMPPLRIIRKIRQLVPVNSKVKKDLAALKAMPKDADLRLSKGLSESLAESIDEEHRNFTMFVTNMFKGHVVSCWHANEFESEAMWKLYGEGHKGVAIQSTVQLLQEALISTETIKIAKVIYTDYEEPSNESLRLLVKSGLGPVMKRMSFAHENEVRAYFLPSEFKVGRDSPSAKSYAVKIKGLNFLEKIVVSPYAIEPYASAVKAISAKYQLGCSVEDSVLLKGLDGLFKLGENNGIY